MEDQQDKLGAPPEEVAQDVKERAQEHGEVNVDEQMAVKDLNKLSAEKQADLGLTVPKNDTEAYNLAMQGEHPHQGKSTLQSIDTKPVDAKDLSFPRTSSRPQGKSSQNVDENLVRENKNEVTKEKVSALRNKAPDAVGWKEEGGWHLGDKWWTDLDNEYLVHQTYIEQFLSEKAYGDWYHNAGVILVGTFLSWGFGRLGFGIFWWVIVCAFAGTYYRTSFRRMKRNYRDDVERASSLKRLETDTETLDWLNSFLSKFWLIYEPVLSDTIITTANSSLADITPPLVESMSMTTFTLGTKPPLFEHVRTFPRTSDDVAIMDWKFSFTPNDTSDMTAKQLKSKVNPKVVLGVRVGKSVVSKNLPILVENMSFSGIMRVRLKMIPSFPHIQTVDIAFLEPPSFDFSLKPIGGDTFGMDINVIPGLSGFIHDTVHASLGPMLYAPHFFQLNIEQLLGGGAYDSAIGVVVVFLGEAHSLRGSDRVGNTVDPYVQFFVDKDDILSRSSIKRNTTEPQWNENDFILVKKLDDILSMEFFDYNDFRKDKYIGSITFPLDQLKDNPIHDGLSSSILANKKERGTLTYGVRYFPVLQGTTLEDGTTEPPPDLSTGIMMLNITSCKGLESSRSVYVELYVNGDITFATKAKKKTKTPEWDEHKEFFVADKAKTIVSLVVKESREIHEDQTLGVYKVKLSDLIDEFNNENDWFNLKGGSSDAQICLGGTWRSIAIEGMSSASGYREPLGVVRFQFDSADHLRNLETVGKSDPYIRVLANNNIQEGRTRTIRNTLNPKWDEIVYIGARTQNERLAIECMDSEAHGKDRSLGKFNFSLGDIMRKNPKGEYQSYDDAKPRTTKFIFKNKSERGDLHFKVSFFPSIPVMSPEDQEEMKQSDRISDAPESDKSQSKGEKAPGLNDKIKEHQIESDKKDAEKLMKKAEKHEDRGTDKQAALREDKRKQAEEKYQKINEKATKLQEQQDAEAKQPKRTSMERQPQKTQSSVDTKENHVAKQTSGSNGKPSNTKPQDKDDEEDDGKLRLSLEELMQYESGFLVFQLHSASIPVTGTYIEFLVDDIPFPSANSAKLSKNKVKLSAIYDMFVRELDWSQFIVNLVERPKTGDPKDILATGSIPTRTLLKKGYNSNVRIPFEGKSGSGFVELSARYIPVQYDLLPREKITNQGILRVDVVGAKDLPVADRGGSSDPYIVFKLDDHTVFKSKVIKRTLNPNWNEFFEVKIPSREKSSFQAIVYDWDLGVANDDLLGKFEVPLADLDTDKSTEKVFDVQGTEKGQCMLKLTFHPGYVQRKKETGGETLLTRAGTFAEPGVQVASFIGGAPAKGVGAATGGIKKGGSFFKHKILHANGKHVVDQSEMDGEAASQTEEAQEGNSGASSGDNGDNGSQSPQPERQSQMNRRSSIASVRSVSTQNGALGFGQVQIIAARGFNSHHPLQVRAYISGKRDREVFKTKSAKESSGGFSWGENFPYRASPDEQLAFKIKAHKALGKDETLGAVTVPLLELEEQGKSAWYKAGDGEINLELSFKPASNRQNKE